MISERLVLGLLWALPACVIHESGTLVQIDLSAERAIALSLGPTVRLTDGVLLLQEVHLEPCPDAAAAVWRALAPVSTAYAHSGPPPSIGPAGQAMPLFVPALTPVELHPAVGRYCGVTPLFAPSAQAPTLQLTLEVDTPAQTVRIESPAWVRPQLELNPPLELSADRPEAQIVLEVDGPRWLEGLDLTGTSTDVLGAALVERFGRALLARVQEPTP
jgi:hypothetical protein